MNDIASQNNYLWIQYINNICDSLSQIASYFCKFSNCCTVPLICSLP